MPADGDIVARQFSYDADARRTFPYIDTYMRLVEPSLPAILADPAQRRRFMLAGLFLSYRAANHQGLTLSTRETGNSFVNDRLGAYKQLTGEDIESTEDYLGKIGFSFWRWRLLGAGRALHRFVVKG